jgi:GT2 family glycosyltransferase
MNPNEMNRNKSVVPVTVVTCARNRGDMIARSLESIQCANPAQVIVVDGNSTDETANIARTMGARVVSDHGAGLGAARQLGAMLSNQPFVAFVDTDTVILPDTLEKLVQEAVANDYDAVTAQLFTLAEQPTYWQQVEDWRRRIQKSAGPASRLGCQATLVRKELIQRVGFDTAFAGAGEDMDFFLRARAAGARLANSSTAVAYHQDRASFGEFVEQQVWYGRGLARMWIRYRSKFLKQASGEAASARRATMLQLRYLPFLICSWGFTLVGAGFEALKVLGDPTLRQQIRQAPMPIPL